MFSITYGYVNTLQKYVCACNSTGMFFTVIFIENKYIYSYLEVDFIFFCFLCKKYIQSSFYKCPFCFFSIKFSLLTWSCDWKQNIERQESHTAPGQLHEHSGWGHHDNQEGHAHDGLSDQHYPWPHSPVASLKRQWNVIFTRRLFC